MVELFVTPFISEYCKYSKKKFINVEMRVTYNRKALQVCRSATAYDVASLRILSPVFDEACCEIECIQLLLWLERVGEVAYVEEIFR